MTDEKGNAGARESTANRHDQFIRDFLSEKETAKSFFLEYLPRKITKNLDFGTLRISKDKFVDKNLSDYFSDLLYSVKLNNMSAFIYLLIEHKSWIDRFVGFQLLKYMVRIWELYLKQHKKAGALPVILPIETRTGALFFYFFSFWARKITEKGEF
jgi:predicted transposase/invertase (TIGR01784 family)